MLATASSGVPASPCTRTAKTPDNGRFALQADVRRRKPEIASELRAVRDAPLDRVGATEHRRGAGRSPVASASRTTVDDARSPPCDTMRIASTLNVAACARSVPMSPARRLPKRKSSPTSTQRTPRRSHHHVGDEGLRRQRGEAGVESRDVDAFDAMRLELRRSSRATWQAAAARRRRRRIRASADRTSARRASARDRRRPRSAAQASPGGRGGRRRNCRSSVQQGRRPQPATLGKSARAVLERQKSAILADFGAFRPPRVAAPTRWRLSARHGAGHSRHCCSSG